MPHSTTDRLTCGQSRDPYGVPCEVRAIASREAPGSNLNSGAWRDPNPLNPIVAELFKNGFRSVVADMPPWEILILSIWEGAFSYGQALGSGRHGVTAAPRPRPTTRLPDYPTTRLPDYPTTLHARYPTPFCRAVWVWSMRDRHKSPSCPCISISGVRRRVAVDARGARNWRLAR